MGVPPTNRNEAKVGQALSPVRVYSYFGMQGQLEPIGKLEGSPGSSEIDRAAGGVIAAEIEAHPAQRRKDLNQTFAALGTASLGWR